MTSAEAETPGRANHRLPGDPIPADALARIIRVDHAGEYGATRIYEGQLAILGRTRAGAVIRGMAEQEKRHLAAFEKQIVAHRVRPTALAPLWSLAGFALGAGTALLGPRAAMACTVAVEDVIDEHYRTQAEQLGEAPTELKATIEEFRADELEHRQTALAHGAREMLGYELLTGIVKTGSRIAIWLSTRL